FPSQLSPEPSLRYLEVILTYRCNLRCRHCYIGEPENVEVPLEKLLQALQEFYEMQGLRVLFSGGEPLIYRHFDELNEFLKDYPLRKVLLTNGTLLTEKRLKGLNFHEIQFSIDGLEVSHDLIRGKGSFKKTIEALKRAKDMGFDVSVATMVHRANLQDFGELEDLLRALGVKEWTVDVPVPEGRLRDNEDLSLPPEVAGPYLRYGFGGGMHGADGPYGCGAHLMAILPEGTAAKCSFYAKMPLGRIEEGLRVCWKRLRPVILDELNCKGCPELYTCRGGCRYRAEVCLIENGPDPYRCYAFGVGRRG
ncbi:MAG: radical SAM protein, partial [Nitrospirae bacterium]